MATSTVEQGLAIRNASRRAAKLGVRQFRLLDLLWALRRDECACARRCVQEHGLAELEERLYDAEAARLASETTVEEPGVQVRAEVQQALAASARRARIASYPCVRTDHMLVTTLELLAARHSAHADLERLRALELDPPGRVRLVPTSRWQFLLLHWLRLSEQGGATTAPRETST